MADITAIILTKDEEINIGDCLKSIRELVCRSVVVDCGSKDKTIEIAKENGAEVFFHEFEYYAKQFNWGLDSTGITTKWVIRIDADERFTSELNKEIIEAIKLHNDDDINGLVIEDWYYFLGKKLKHSSGTKRKLMVFKNGCGRIEDRKRDAHTILSLGKSVVLHERFLHYDFKDIDSYIKKYNWYATREMYDYIDYKNGRVEMQVDDNELKKTRKKKFGLYYKSPMFIRAWFWFIYKYIFKLGFLDGREGFVFNYFECYWYRFVVDAKIYEYEITGKHLKRLESLGD